MSGEGGREIQRQDEVLELLYWLEGEGFPGAATLDGITRFLADPDHPVADTLTLLATRGDVVFQDTGGSGEYKLTDVGRREAGRRFAEEFSSMLSQGHAECNDPNCDCHTNPAGAAECHAARAHGDHQH